MPHIPDRPLVDQALACRGGADLREPSGATNQASGRCENAARRGAILYVTEQKSAEVVVVPGLGIRRRRTKQEKTRYSDG